MRNMSVESVLDSGLKEFIVERAAVGINEMLIKRARMELVSKLEGAFVAALSRKGFDFNNRYELTEFVKGHCTATDNTMLKERVYYVDGTPFFIHYYGVSVDGQTDRGKVTFNGGSYGYL